MLIHLIDLTVNHDKVYISRISFLRELVSVICIPSTPTEGDKYCF